MKSMRACMIAAGLVATTGSFGATPAARVFALASPSVWSVVTYDEDGLRLAQGSGVVVDEDALVTNCHVLAKAKRVAVRREKTSIDAKLVLWDPERDVCKLQAPGMNGRKAVLADTSTITVGQSVYAVGSPMGLEQTLSAGLISSVRRNETGSIILLQTSAAVSAGSSGGGLFDEEGRLVGLTTIAAVGGGAQNLNFAIPAEWIRELPDRHARLLRAAESTTASGSSRGISSKPDASTLGSAPAATSRPVARIDDVSLLPYASEQMRERYRVFLTRPFPRAFAISEGGAWRQAWNDPIKNRRKLGSPAQRALQECEESNTGRCFLYAVDGDVVYSP